MLLVTLETGFAHAEVILLQREDGEHGVGWLFRDQAGDCRIATPRHVIEDSAHELVAPNAIDRHDRVLATSQPVAPDPGLDLAFLHVEGVLADEGCSLSRLSSVPLDYFISNWTHGVLSVATPVDGQQTIQVERLVSTRDSAGGGTIAIGAAAGSGTLQKGMSGGVVMAGDRPIAMLIEVDSETETGIALRFDLIAAALAAVETETAGSAAHAKPRGSVQDVAVLDGLIRPGGSIEAFLDQGQPLVLAAKSGRVVLLVRSRGPVSTTGLELRMDTDDRPVDKVIVEAAAGSGPLAIVRICDGGDDARELVCQFAPRRLDRVQTHLGARGRQGHSASRYRLPRRRRLART